MTETPNTPAPRASAATLASQAGVGVAAATAALTAATLVHFGLGARGVIGAALCAVLVLLAWFDLDQRRIPNRIVLPAIGVVLAAQLLFFPGAALEWIGAGLAAGAILFVPRLFKAEAVGIGDVKLAILLGVGLGGDVIIALLLASLSMAPVALWILITRGVGARNDVIPFGPFLALGGILALFLGDLPGA
jgi:leader peptidase (prepilin peptidase) / N-methyltransferase